MTHHIERVETAPFVSVDLIPPVNWPARHAETRVQKIDTARLDQAVRNTYRGDIKYVAHQVLADQDERRWQGDFGLIRAEYHRLGKLP